MISDTDYLQLDALAMVSGLARKEFSSVQLVERAIERAGRLNPLLNAISYPDYDSAHALALAADQGTLPGRFAGVPFLIKEIAAVAGLPHTHHSRLFADQVATQDSAIVRAFRKTGLISLGTTNTPELCVTITTESRLRGPCRNPWNLQHSTGGSSGGAAAAVATGIVPVAHGSDGGGSIRIPAACCGVFGLKVSRGLTPVEPELHQSWSGLSVNHVLSRSVRDSAAMLDAICLHYPGLYPLPADHANFLSRLQTAPGPLRIAVLPTHPFAAEIDVEISRALVQAADLCRDLGHKLQEAPLPVDFTKLGNAFITITNVHTAQALLPRLGVSGLSIDQAPLEAATRRMAERGLKVSAADFLAAQDQINLAARQMQEFHRDFDVILSPVLSTPPAPLGWLNADSSDLKEYGNRFGKYSGFCHLFNTTGQPSMSVPLFQTAAGLPLGLLFSAAWGADALLLRLARQLEQSLPWFDRLPDACGAPSQ